jgi:hypothetical protein
MAEVPRQLDAAPFVAKLQSGQGDETHECQMRDDTSATLVRVPDDGEPKQGDPAVLLLANFSFDGRRCHAVITFLDENTGWVCVTASSTGKIESEYQL